MSRYHEKDYSLSTALYNIGDYFWKLYREDLKQYAEDRTRTDIVKRIHQEWDNPPALNPTGTDIRIEWALAIYDHGDWQKSLSFPVPPFKGTVSASQAIDPRRKYPAEYRCDNGIYVRSLSELCIANWLYFNRIPFEYERQVVFAKSKETAHCDFYLPEKNIYIEFWGMSKDSAYVQYKQWKEPLYAQNELRLISLYPADLKNLRDRFFAALSKCDGNQPQRGLEPARLPKASSPNYDTMKIGQIAQTALRKVLEQGKITQTELSLLQEAEYSKTNFDIQYPLLKKASSGIRPLHYYATPVTISGEKYYICCEWYENAANNDRPFLLKWLNRHIGAN